MAQLEIDNKSERYVQIAEVADQIVWLVRINRAAENCAENPIDNRCVIVSWVDLDQLGYAIGSTPQSVTIIALSFPTSFASVIPLSRSVEQSFHDQKVRGPLPPDHVRAEIVRGRGIARQEEGRLCRLHLRFA